MRKIISAILFFWLASFTSCLDKNDYRQDSIYKTDILSYLRQLKSKVSGARAQKIDELTNAVDFKNVEIYKLRTTEMAIIADLKPYGSFDNPDRLKAIFFLNQNKIVRSSIVSFKNKTGFDEYNQVILSILNMDKSRHNYSGKISFYGPFQDPLLFDVLENGKLNVNGITRTKNTKNGSGRTDACINWYWVTTYYYANGTTDTSEEYLFTTCGCEEQTTRVGRIECGGGNGAIGGSGPLFPTSPRSGDIYEFTDVDGKYTKYVFNNNINTWTIVEIILPEMLVQSQPNNYPYLQSDGPFEGDVRYGPDGMIYVYNAGSGGWVSDLYMVSGRGTIIPNKSLYLECLDRNNPATVTIYVDQPKPETRDVINGGYVGHAFIGITQMQNNGTLNVSRFFGFYPETYAAPNNTSDNGVLKVDEGHEYNISLSISITPAKLSELINYITNNNRSYDLSTYNCTSYVLSIANNVLGINLPSSSSCWLPNSPSGCGNNPGDLGEDLRNRGGATSSPNSHAPANSGCPADLP